MLIESCSLALAVGLYALGGINCSEQRSSSIVPKASLKALPLLGMVALGNLNANPQVNLPGIAMAQPDGKHLFWQTTS